MTTIHRIGLLGCDEKHPMIIEMNQVLEELKSMKPQTTDHLIEATRESVQVSPTHYSKLHFAFVDGTCNTVLPRLRELEEAGQSLKDDHLLEQCIHMLFIDQDLPDVDELDLRQVRDLYYALPRIIEKLRDMDSEWAVVVADKTQKFLRNLAQTVQQRK